MPGMEETQIEAAATAPELGSTAVPNDVDNGLQEEETPKVFTQAELDAKVGERLAKERRKWERDQQLKTVDQPVTPASDPPKQDQYKTAEEYLDALADWKADQKIAKREAEKQKTVAATKFDEQEDEARAKYTDYEKVTRSEDLKITATMLDTIKESPIGPEIAYHLGKNPDEAERIAGLKSTLAQAREIGKLEAKLSDDNQTPQDDQPSKKTSSAPEPITPVRSRGSAQNYSPSDPRSIKTMSPEEWIAARNAEIAKRNK